MKKCGNTSAVAHRLAGMGVGGERGDFGIGMPRQQAHRVGAGVAGRTPEVPIYFFVLVHQRSF